jgi:multidrug efflux system membrane fusion protein
LANLESAKATVASLKRDLENTQIVAPFDGILNERQVEVGDYLSVGDAIAQLVDMDPLVIRADVTESHIQSLTVGGAATGRLATGQHVEGVIRYISSVSTAGTNTFPIEVAVDNTDDKFVAGISTELSIAYDSTWAIKLSSGLMSLDEQGNLGIKTVEDDVVHFVPIDLVKSDKFGVWLSGLGQQAEVITLGQGFVRDGDKVEVVVK